MDNVIKGNLTVMGNATTTGNFVVGIDKDHNIPGCIGLRTSDGKWVFAYVASATEVVNKSLTWSENDCSGSATSTILIGQ